VSRTGSLGKEKLLEVFVKLLESDTDLDFLLQLQEGCLERLIVAVRTRLERTM
jgi:hypothetical protein